MKLSGVILMNKKYLQNCSIFIGLSLIIISIPFAILMYGWSQEIGYVLLMSGICLIGITVVHKWIFNR